MDTPAPPLSQDLEYLYKEYVRLSNRLDTIVDSSWGDFKLLGAVGALFAWPPIAKSDLFGHTDTSVTLFIGFTGILFIVAVIATRDLIKQSIIEHYLHELKVYEQDIRDKLGNRVNHSFQLANHWLARRQGAWKRITFCFYVLFYLCLFSFPVAVLVWQTSYSYAITYGVVTLVTLGIYWVGARTLKIE